MYNPNCPRCSGPVDPGFRFCKNCGLDLANPQLAYAPPPQQTADRDANRLLTVLLVKYGIVVFTFIVSWLINLLEMWKVFRFINILTAIAVIVVLLIMAINAQQPKIRVWLWVFFGIEIVQAIAGLLMFNSHSAFGF